MLIDTSGLLCLVDRAEQHHRKASRCYYAARTRLTHSYVLAEWVPLAQTRGLPRPTALAFAAGTLTNPLIHVVWVDQPLHQEAVSLLLARPDKLYSLCDAVSFVLMRRLAIIDALTTDKHFEQEGFRRLLK